MSIVARMAGLAVVMAFALSGPAFAHAHLKSSVPAADATLASPPRLIELTFTEAVELKFTGISVTGPDKAAVATAEPMLMDKDVTLMVTVPGPLAAGTYTVDWHALSTDGHKTTGSYKFTVQL